MWPKTRGYSDVLTAVVLVALLASYPTAAPKYDQWSAPVNLGAVVNSTSNDQGPAISKDGLSLYFSSGRPGGSGGSDIWVSRRDSLEAAWGPPENLNKFGGVVNTTADDSIPALSRDEHRLFFNSNRSGGSGDTDIWVSYRQHTHDDFGWQMPVHLEGGVNSPFKDQGAGYFENDEGGAPLLFFGSDRSGGPGMNDIYVSQLLQLLPDRVSSGPASLIAELSSLGDDLRPSVRFDGLEVFFFSNRPESAASDLWTATRQTVLDFWSKPKNLGPVNSPANEMHPYIAPDRRTLYFASNRPGGSGMQDLYVTTRTMQHP
jgi:Tol biopolymer transport system component